MKNYLKFKKQLLKDKEIKQTYEELGPEFEIIKLFIQWRFNRGISQRDLARRIGTKQSAISRFEKGRYNPTLHFLNKMANGLEAKVKITLSSSASK